MDGNTFKLVRFSEVETDGKLAWYFFADQCRHCLEPPCKDAIEGYVDGGVELDEATGAIYYTPKAKEAPFDEVRSSCPYDIPRQAADGRVVKCTMCIDRVSNGLIPACVKICPTGAMNFGERDAMLALANENGWRRSRPGIPRPNCWMPIRSGSSTWWLTIRESITRTR